MLYYITGVSKVENLNSFENACAGFCAAFFSSLTLCPTELIKCRLQAMREVQIHNNPSAINVVNIKARERIKKNTKL
jgi:solute carrier family 25 ornithine transporter 2/15